MVTFEDHKKTVEDFLQTVDFFYSGDVISSTDLTFFEKSNQTNISHKFIRDCFIDIYKKSFENMIQKSEEIVIHRSQFIDVYDIFNKISINPKILFYSENSNRNLNLGHDRNELEDGHSYLPTYFSKRFKCMSQGIEVSAFYSPEIIDSQDDCVFYLVDRPIQSMVWSLQNMTYNINKTVHLNEHLIKIPFYDCDFKSLKIRVIDTIKLREDKINSILNGN